MGRLGVEVFFAVILGFIVVGLAGVVLWRPVSNYLLDKFVKRLMKDRYTENIGEMYNVFTKVGVQNIFEGDLRGSRGKPLERPFGSPRKLSPWEKLTLNPVYLSRKPVVESVTIDTKTVIGPQAKRPLHIDMPIMIAGMAYGTGLSLQAKIALAKGADMVNTATNTGAGPFLPEERKHTKRLIIQYHRGYWSKEEEVLRQADAVEIQLGYGACGSAPLTWRFTDFSGEFRDYIKLNPGEGLLEEAMLDKGKDGAELAALVTYLRKVTNGVPIGIKFGATHLLEKELEIFVNAGIDFLSIAGAEAGIQYGPPILADDAGLPSLPALCRTIYFLNSRALKGKISVILSGGLVTPGQFLKALALGADAVAVGTIAALVLAHNQLVKVFPWEPPTQLIYENGKFKDRLSVEAGAKSVANFLKSCNEEIIMGMRALGKSSLKELSPADLSALAPEVARMTGAELALFAPGGAG